MKTIFAFLFALVGVSSATISTATKPHIIDSAATPKVSYVDDNDEALLDKLNEVIDTANTYLGGGVSSSILSTTGDQRLTIDSDNNGSNRWFVTSGGTTDTLLRILEGGAWTVYGAGVGTKLTLSDSILAATMRISGLTASRLMATNADKTAASVSDLTAWVAGTANQITSTSDGDGSITLSIPNGFTLPSASPTFTGLTLSGLAGTGTRLTTSTSAGVLGNATTIAGAYTMSGTFALGAGLQMENGQNISMKNTSGTLRNVLGVGATNNTEIGGTVDGGISFFTNLGNNAGTVSSAGAWAIPGTLAVTSAITGAQSGGGSNGGFIASSGTPGYSINETDATADNRWWDIVAASEVLYFRAVNDANSTSGSFMVVNRTGTTIDAVNFPGSGGVAVTGPLGVTGAITGSNLSGTNTGDQTNISGNAATVTTNANLTGPITSVGNATSIASQTGTGTTFMMSASPTTTGTLTAAAITASGAVTASTVTTGGGEAFTYGDTSFTITVSTGMTTTPSGTAKATRIGKVVTMEIPFLEGTSNSTQLVLSGVPTTWKPATNIQYVPLVCTENNGVDYYSNGSFVMVQDALNGSINIGFAGSMTGWTNSGTKAVGCNMFSGTNVITYLLQ